MEFFIVLKCGCFAYLQSLLTQLLTYLFKSVDSLWWWRTQCC